LQPIVIQSNLPQQSRHQLLMLALPFLEKYYKPIALKEKVQLRPYVFTRDGKMLEALIAVKQPERFLLASVTTCDVPYFTEQLYRLRTPTKAPKPNADMMIVECIVVALLVLYALRDNIMAAAAMAIMVGIAYFLFRGFNEADYSLKLNQTPARWLYALLPPIEFPTHEDWLVVSQEAVIKFPDINIAALRAYCFNEKIGLIIINTDGIPDIYVRPGHRVGLVDTKYDIDF
jgi:hypothetical protein